MGLPVFSNICTGLLPMLIINIAFSIALIKHAFHSFLQALGLLRKAPTSNDGTAHFGFPDGYNLCSELMFPGLSEEICQALPLTVYDPDLGNDALNLVDAECPVCLQGFQREQELRLLPLCKHVFHRGCLDQWLDHQHATCPLCRISLVSDDISKKQRRREQELSDEVIFWFSPFHGSGFQGLWSHI